MDGVVLILALILNPRAEKRRRRLLEAMGVEEGQDLQATPAAEPISIPESESSKRELAANTDVKCERDDTNDIDRVPESSENGPQH